MKSFIGVITAIIGIAILATLISGRANTAKIIKGITGTFSNLLKSALKPIS